MTLEQALHYIHAVCWKGSIPGLERINALLDKLDHPERACKFVHVAGTNGKGSTCAMLASIFQAGGNLRADRVHQALCRLDFRAADRV